MAAALLTHAEIEPRLTVIWVGGGRYPHGSSPEAYLKNDLLAANIVFASSVQLWQIPSNTYKTLLVPTSEIELKLANSGKVGRYLYRQMIDFANENLQEKTWINSECWVLGDSAGVGVLLDEQKGSYTESVAPYFLEDCEHDFHKNRHKRMIRVYSQLNGRMILEDMFSKTILFDRKN